MPADGRRDLIWRLKGKTVVKKKEEERVRSEVLTVMKI
jgi:hypothetical protein